MNNGAVAAADVAAEAVVTGKNSHAIARPGRIAQNGRADRDRNAKAGHVRNAIADLDLSGLASRARNVQIEIADRDRHE